MSISFCLASGGMGRRVKGEASSEEGLDMPDHLRRIPGLGRDEFFNHFTVAIDQVAFGILDGAVGEVDLLVGITRSEVGEGRPDEKVAINFFVLIDADAEDDKSLRAQLPGHLIQAGNLFNAGAAPRSPEIQEQEFAAEVTRRDGLARIRLNAEIRGGVAGIHHGFVQGSIKGTAKRHQHQSERGLKDPISFHLTVNYNSIGSRGVKERGALEVAGRQPKT